jgi:cation transport protein ChaC
MWIFGYGSLMWDGWEKAFSCNRRLTGKLHGYRRTFNKLSVKNWGTKSNPGPTLNLVVAGHGICTGIAFEFPDDQSNNLKSYLAKREGKGFAFKLHTVVVAELGERRSGSVKLNSAISGNSGPDAGPKMVWREGVSDGQEIRAAHPAHAYARVQGPSGFGRIA